MTNFLIKLFIKDSANVADIRVRTSYGNLGGITGIICNLILFTIKLLGGLVSGSFSIIADAFNNLGDLGSSLITLIGFKLSSKPADKDHPYGHGRMEYIAAFVVSCAIIIVGVELLKGSVEKIIEPEAPTAGIFTAAVLIISIFIKLWMAYFNRKLGKMISSDVLIATSKDSLNDCISTSAVLTAMVILYLFEINIDAYIGLAVSVMIIWSGIKSVKETLDPLLGVPPRKEDIKEIQKIVSTTPDYLGIHDLIFHNYGPGRTFCSLHLEVPQNVNILSCHENIDKLEKTIYEKLGIETVIHMDPVAVGDPFTDEAKRIIGDIIKDIDERLHFHDFRVVMGEERINLIFDVVLSSDVNLSSDEVKRIISERANKADRRFCTVITIDNDYVE